LTLLNRDRGRLAAAGVAACRCVAAGVSGQPGERDMPDLEGLRPLSEVPVLTTPAVVGSPSRIEAEPAGGPVPFAEPFAVEVTTAGRGAWEVTSDGRFAVWRLRVTSPGAVSLNFGFTRYGMPLKEYRNGPGHGRRRRSRTTDVTAFPEASVSAESVRQFVNRLARRQSSPESSALHPHSTRGRSFHPASMGVTR